MHERSEFRIQGSSSGIQSGSESGMGSRTQSVPSSSGPGQAVAMGADTVVSASSLSMPPSPSAGQPCSNGVDEAHTQPIDVDGEPLGPEDLPAPPSPAPSTPPVVLRVLYLFAGEERKTDVSHMIKKKAKEVDLPIEVEEVDTCRGDQCDVGPSAVWDPIIIRLRAGVYAALIVSPPCNTWTRARNHRRNGPPPLRSSTHPWGVPVA